MIDSTDSSTDSSIGSDVQIRRIQPRFEIISDLDTFYNSQTSYSPLSSNNSQSPISSLGYDSPIRRNVPNAIRVLDSQVLDSQVLDSRVLDSQALVSQAFVSRVADVEAQIVDDVNSINSEESSYFLFDENEEKPFFYRIILVTIWLSYLIGVIVMKKSDFTKVSPDAEYMKLSYISDYPQCSDQRSELWRFFTSAITHGDIGHIIINSIVIYPSMYIIEIAEGYKFLIGLILFACFYVSIIFNYFQPYDSVVGCSHLVFALNGCILSYLIVNYYNLDTRLLTITGLYLFLTTLIEVISYFLLFSKNTAYICHWSGWLMGIIYGLIFIQDIATRKINLKALLVGSNLLTLITIYFLYTYITNWPPKGIDEFNTYDFPFCCELLLFNKLNQSNPKCYI